MLLYVALNASDSVVNQFPFLQGRREDNYLNVSNKSYFFSGDKIGCSLKQKEITKWTRERDD